MMSRLQVIARWSAGCEVVALERCCQGLEILYVDV